MRERVEVLGREFAIGSEPGERTEVSGTIPRGRSA